MYNKHEVSPMIGIDLCQIQRLERIYKKHGDRFINWVFSPKEQAYLRKRKMAPRTMAGLFAAKEAMAKALGRGIGPVALRDLEVGHGPGPWGAWKGYRFDLSISHEGDYALAVARIQESGPSFSLPEFLQGQLKKRELNAHKGSVGKLALLAGRRGMVGAFVYAAKALYRSGAGMVFGLVDSEDQPVFTLAAPEVVLRDRKSGLAPLLDQVDALVLGPGLGLEDPALAEGLSAPIKKVVDAGGLTYLSGLDQLPDLRGAVLTPHEAEAQRLFHCQAPRQDLMTLAKGFARDKNCVFVLKGPGTYVTDGHRDYVNSTGNPSMAVAGMGDCLSGIIGYYLTALEDPFLAASMGVFVHGAAGDLANEKYGQSLMPLDVIEEIPQVLKKIL